MAKIKDLGAIAEKYSRVTPGRTQDYQAGVQQTNPADFENRAAAGADNWQAGVTQAAAEGRFAAGIRGAGAKWQRKATQVGVGRFGPGVQAAREDYSSGFEPFHRIIQGLTLDPRGPRGDPRNIQRVNQLAQALNAARRR